MQDSRAEYSPHPSSRETLKSESFEDDPGAKRGQTAIVIPAIGLEGCPDLTFQIQFFVRDEPWPEITTIAVPDVDESGNLMMVDGDAA